MNDTKYTEEQIEWAPLFRYFWSVKKYCSR